MGQKRYPTLTFREVRDVLLSRGFYLKGQRGSHQQWERPAGEGRIRAVVTLDDNAAPFDDYLLKMMIRQSGLTRDDFYSSTPATAKKAVFGT